MGPPIRAGLEVSRFETQDCESGKGEENLPEVRSYENFCLGSASS